MDFEKLKQEVLKAMRNPEDTRTMDDLITQYGSKELMLEFKKPDYMQGGQ